MPFIKSNKERTHIRYYIYKNEENNSLDILISSKNDIILSYSQNDNGCYCKQIKVCLCNFKNQISVI